MTNPGMMTQHTRFSTLVLALALSMGWMGCKPDLQGELGEPFPKFEGMIGELAIGKFVATGPPKPSERNS